jgi:hypothetical protein
MVHLPPAMLRPNLLKISESAFVAVWVHPDEERPAGSRRRALLRVHYIKPGGGG